MHHVETAFDEEEGGVVYDTSTRKCSTTPVPAVRLPAHEVRDCKYFRAVLSCGPHARRRRRCRVPACIVLLPAHDQG
uniref:Uncharacterized protein n=1 Tax=Oryza meridionalis TaxID=40149 RepID=A0A0E0F7D1_9ORYZ